LPPHCATSWRRSELEDALVELDAAASLADRIWTTETGRITEERARRFAVVLTEAHDLGSALLAAVTGPRGGGVMPSPQPPSEP
jgi:hypothetical protein